MPETSNDFIPLEAFLRPPPCQADSVASPEPVAAQPLPESETEGELAAALRGARRFRAALADAFDASLDQLLADLAASVLARELRLEPVAIRQIVAGTLERHRAEEPLRVRVHPDEVAALEGIDVAIAADAQLRRGDAVLELKSGTIDARLGTRLETLVDERLQ